MNYLTSRFSCLASNLYNANGWAKLKYTLGNTTKLFTGYKVFQNAPSLPKVGLFTGIACVGLAAFAVSSVYIYIRSQKTDSKDQEKAENAENLSSNLSTENAQTFSEQTIIANQKNLTTED